MPRTQITPNQMVYPEFQQALVSGSPRAEYPVTVVYTNQANGTARFGRVRLLSGTAA